MKKTIISSMAIIATMGIIIACTPEQQTAVSRQLGIAAAVTWVGIDNPSAEDIGAVKGVVNVIQELSCTNCSENTSYYASLYPLVDEYISSKVEINQQPMARLGASFVLTSLDTAFAMNPTWKENANTATSMVRAFCEGVNIGLSMTPTDPVMIAARQGIAVRSVSGRKQ